MYKNVRWQMTGIEELQFLLTQMQNDFGEKDQKKILNKAARKAMLPTLNKAKQLAPIDTGGLRASLRIEARKPTRKDKKSIYVNPSDVVIGTVTTGSGKQLAKVKFKNVKTGQKQKGVESDGRAIANEFGTATKAARPYMRPALDATKNQITSEIGELLKTELQKYKSKKA